MVPEAVKDQFEQQAQSCERLGSPFTVRLCRLLPQVLTGETETGRAVAGWTHGPDAALPLRLCGALHRLVLAEADADLAAAYPPEPAADAELAAAVRAAIAAHDRSIAAMLDSPPQTNEVARAAGLLPGFLTVAREARLPLELCEIGSSSGLLLGFDRFFYDYGAASWGDAASAVRLQPEMHGDVPDLSGELTVAARRGCDRSPIRLADPEARLRLRGYVWADQPQRLARLDAATEVSRALDVSVEQADGTDFIQTALERRRDGTTLCVFHSIVWQYLPNETQRTITDMMERAGREATADRPLAWLRMEPDGREPGAALLLQLWPGDGALRHLGRIDYHGRWLDWRG
ncbi:DUF2332 domain-containing protein [Jiella sp. M17.18]|uniref:DUF2332 domain-containing protein n=1 Tax=Jiella sp. M17.18 TaxID=3234247 RepID=UPI0034DF8B71